MWLYRSDTVERSSRALQLPHKEDRVIPSHLLNRSALPPETSAIERTAAWERLGFGMAWLLVMSIPWGDMVLLNYDVQVSRVFSVVTCMAWFFILWRAKASRVLRPVHWFLLLFLIWAAVSAMWSQETERGLRRSLSYMQLFMVVWVIHQASGSRKQHLRLLQAYVIGSCGPIVSLLLNFAGQRHLGDGRYTATGLDPNDLAVTLSLGIPIAWFLNIHTREYRWVNRLFVPAAVVSILLTASRSGFVALTIVSIYLLSTLPCTSRKTALGIVVIVALSAGIIGCMWNEIPVHRLSSIAEQLTARDLNGRVGIWQRGVDAFLEHPITGVGAAGFGAAVGAIRSRELAAHNTLLGVLVEHGLIGFTLFAGAVLSMLAGTWRSSGDLVKLCTFLAIAWGVSVFTLSWENKEITWLLFGLCGSVPRIRKISSCRVVYEVRKAYA
jgi:O-antigen ligase